MVFFIYILFSLLPSTVDLSIQDDIANNNEHLSNLINRRISIDNLSSAVSNRLLKSGNYKDKSQLKYLKRKSITRYFAVCSSSCFGLSNHFRFFTKNTITDNYFLSIYLHPNSLRAPPVISCI